jgi:FkbM family methyltransferase
MATLHRYAASIGRRLLALAGRLLGERLPPLLLRTAMISAAVSVKETLTFAGRELFSRRCVGEYHLRRSGRTLFVRHPASDAWVVYEVLRRGVYLPPPEVERAIRAGTAAPRIVDLGAHVGSASLLLLERFPGAHVVAVEPNPDSAALLRRTVERNGLSAQWEVRQVAAGTERGTASIEGFSILSHFVREGAVEAIDYQPYLRRFQQDAPARPTQVEVVDVFDLLQEADLVKMDIEGAEWPILQDPRFAQLPISALVLEYHPQGSPEHDTTALVSRLLEQAGFRLGKVFDEHDRVGLVWAWR